jgi:potassium-dependent mechanosensitive channel
VGRLSPNARPDVSAPHPGKDWRIVNRLRHISIALLLAIAWPSAEATAQLSLLSPIQSKQAQGEAAPVPDTTAKRAENARLLRIAQRETANAAASNGDSSKEVDVLKSIDAVLAQQQAVEQQIAELESRQAELRKGLQSLGTQGIGEKPPYSFLLFDRLGDEVAAEQSRQSALADKVAAATAAREQAESALDQSQRTKRQAQSAVDANNDPEQTASLAAALAKAGQDVTLASETLVLRKKELAREKLTQDVQALTLQLAAAKLAEVKKQVEFSQGDLEQVLAQIQKQEEDVKLEVSSAEGNLRRVEDAWTEARNKYDQGNGDHQQLAEEVEAWRLAREAVQQKINMLNRQLQRLTQLRTLWERRFQVVSGAPSSDDVSKWLDETKQILKELDREASVQRANIDERRKIAATLDTKVENAQQESPKLAHWISEQVAQVRGMVGLYERELTSIENARRLHEKLAAEIAPDRLKISPLEWWSAVRRHAVAFWNFELTTIDESPLYVKTIFKGILFLVIGIILARFVSALVIKRLLGKSKISRDAKAAIQTLMFYTLVVFVVVFVLATVQVPLTVFTVIGGALALGVGLGSQNLVNNFLSGLIVMAERPVRIGERIVFGNYDGFVEEVGFRSTRIRTLTDHVVMIPNASLVSESIENIERRRCIRRLFNVTITYDTPREKIVEAVQVIRNILEEDGLREPIHPVFGWDEYPPRVVFNEYNADSLNILVVYWYAPPNFWDYLLHSERVNLRILEEFERLGVEFAFPTQTLYLARDQRRPLAVELLNKGDHPAHNGRRADPNPYA